MNVTISTFFSGTGHEASDDRTLVHLLNDHINTNNNQKSIAFDGCGVTHGITGVIFGAGLDEQCQQVISQVQSEIEKGNSVTLNVYGHSRGGIGALMLAKQLSSINPDVLDINLALLDPVPGNLITTSTIDPLEISLANKTMDLRECKPLKRVLALYPHIPLPALSFHAPLFSLYPEHTQVEQDAIAGCHAGAQFHNIFGNNILFSNESFITFARIYTFLKECGSQFKPFPELGIMYSSVEVNQDNLDDALLKVYADVNESLNLVTDRDTHSATDINIKTKEKADFFNVHHQRLAGVAEDKNNARVTIEENQGFFSQIKRACHNYPIAWQAIKWSVIGIGISSLLVLTGGAGALPLIGAGLAQLGWLGIVALTPLVTGVLAGIWYGALKPLTDWVVNKVFYPMFDMREFHAVKQPGNQSTQYMINNFGVNPEENINPINNPEPKTSGTLFATPSEDLVYIPENINDNRLQA